MGEGRSGRMGGPSLTAFEFAGRSVVRELFRRDGLPEEEVLFICIEVVLVVSLQAIRGICDLDTVIIESPENSCPATFLCDDAIAAA